MVEHGQLVSLFVIHFSSSELTWQLFVDNEHN